MENKKEVLLEKYFPGTNNYCLFLSVVMRGLVLGSFFVINKGLTATERDILSLKEAALDERVCTSGFATARNVHLTALKIIEKDIL